MNRLRVLFVIPGVARGNSMIFARRQAESLRRAGVDVAEFHLRSRTSLALVAQEWLRFRGCLRRFAPHVVHAHFGTVTAMFAALAAPGVPLVITFRGGDLNPPSPKASVREKLRAALGRVLSQLAALRAAQMICVSGQLRTRLWWRRNHAVVLPSGVDPEVFAPEPRLRARQRLGWIEAERVILFNAGGDPLIKRLDLARQAVEQAKLHVGGLRMVILDGGTPPAQMPALMNAADCLLLTSDAEGSPTVIQEALACNLPVVSVDVGDTAERLRGVAASHVVARHPEAIARALAGILSPPTRSDGRRKMPEFSSNRIAGELQRIYLDLARPPRLAVLEDLS